MERNHPEVSSAPLHILKVLISRNMSFGIKERDPTNFEEHSATFIQNVSLRNHQVKCNSNDKSYSTFIQGVRMISNSLVHSGFHSFSRVLLLMYYCKGVF